jgi:hypothetical protein
MGKESNEEKQFSEDVDRLLAGQEVEGGKDAGEDYRAAINFAKKLTGFHADPSPHFKAKLKERLLLELAKQEADARQKAKGNRFWEGLKNLLPREAVWRNATATAVLMLVAVGVLWGTGVFTPSVTPEREPAPGEASLAPPGQDFELETALDKTIELNQTQTAGGLSITLEQVVLSPGGITFSAFTTPPDYSLPQDFQGPMPPGMAPAVAEYTVNGTTRYAGDAEATFLENGILLTWSNSQLSLELVPDGATEIVLTIISFGDWQGPWEFIIPLQD